ncbi:MAG: hypothetical protein IKY94_15210 [Lachnospiraceae bacterium]|nr:hypothetical protein [Lachnospiraceae bacterium]
MGRTITLWKGVAASADAATIAVTRFSAVLLAIAAVGFVAFKIFDKLHISQKEATEAIDEATESYRIQKEALDELNNSLKSVQERIEELSNQDTLTIVEQDELDKLKQEEAYLKQQIAL